MNAKRVCAAAGVIFAAQQTRQTAAGIATALESAQLLQSPETAAELAKLRQQASAGLTDLSAEDRATIAEQIGDAKPATDRLLQQIAESVRDVREHDHSGMHEDLYCMNLTSWMGERMAVVLRRLMDTEADAARLRAERDVFCDRVDTLTAVAKGNKRYVQDMYLELQKAQARVAELERERHTTNDAIAEAHLALATKEPAEPASPAQQAAAEIQAMHDPTVIGYIVGVDWLSLTLRPRALADWQAWLDRLGADLAHVTHRGATSTAKGSWNGVPVAVQAHGVGALLAAARTTTGSGAV